MLGKLTAKASFSSAAEGAKATSAEASRLGLFADAKINSANLPQAPQSAFRKRPVRLDYDKNEFYTFRMPSERDFFLGPFEKNDIFGKRNGLQHSPHIKAQMDIDTRILLGLIGVSVLMVTTEFKKNGRLLNLRENFRSVSDGRFEADDFIKKQ